MVHPHGDDPPGHHSNDPEQEEDGKALERAETMLIIYATFVVSPKANRENNRPVSPNVGAPAGARSGACRRWRYVPRIPPARGRFNCFYINKRCNEEYSPSGNVVILPELFH